VEEMRKALFLAGVIVATLLAHNITAKTREPNTPLPQKAQLSVTALEAQIAKLKVERLGLLGEWKPTSTPVRAADRKLAALYKQLSLARPYDAKASVHAEEKAIQAKISQLETVKRYFDDRYQTDQLATEKKYVSNYLSVLRNRLAQLRTLPPMST
jgi:hypothetical protein